MTREEIAHEEHLRIAKNMLALQAASIDEIVGATILQKEEVEHLAAVVYEEKYKLTARLREIMYTIMHETPDRDQMEKMLFDTIYILNRMIHMRELGRGEAADIKRWIKDMNSHDLSLYLDRLYVEGSDMEVLMHGQAFLDRVYALFTRTHYDDLRKHDADFIMGDIADE